MQLFSSIKSLILIFLLTLLIVAALFWLYLNVQASMQVDAQQAQIELSDSLPTKIHVGNYLNAHAKGALATQIDLDRQLDLPLKGKYLADLQFSVVVPVSVSIDYQTMIHIDQLMPLDATTDLIYKNRFLPKFPIHLDIPIRLDVPFHLKRSYDIPIEIFFNGPVYFEFDEKVRLHVLHSFAPQLNIDDPIILSKIASFNATMYNTQRQTTANLNMHMTLPLKNIHP